MKNKLHSTVVAKELLNLSKGNGGLTQLQLQKLVYFAHGIYMIEGDSSEGLVSDEIRAWKYGPVFKDLRNVTKHYGGDKISKLDNDFVNNEKPTEKQSAFIKAIFETFGDLSGVSLSAMTHQDGSPWHEVYVKQGNKKGVISDELIRQYFTDLNNG